MRPGAKAFLCLALGLGLLAAMLVYVGPAQILRALAAASPLYLGLAVGAYALFFLLRGIRWRILLAQGAPDVRLSSTIGVTAVGWLANSILPFKSGDVLRAAVIARRERIGIATSAGTVGLERVMDLIGLAILAALGLRLLPHATQLPPGIERALAIAWVIPLVALLVLALLVRYRARTVRIASAALRPFGKVGAKLVSFGDTLLAGLHALARKPRLLLVLAPLTLTISLTQALIFTCLVIAFLPTTPPLLAFAGSAIFLLSFVVSITPGNIGTYEAAFVAIFVGLGHAAEAAVPAAILTHVTTTLTVAVLGSLALFALGTKPGALHLRPIAQGGASR